MTTVDIFTNVHKGIRRALFEACVALGRASEGGEDARAARQALGEALHFVRHHGDNEDTLLVPLLQRHAPEIAARMAEAHRRIEGALAELEGCAAASSVHELYLRAGAFVALYMDHMREEEQELEPRIRAAVDAAALAGAGRGAVARTAPGDQRMMLGWMLPAMPRAEADAFLSLLPREMAEELGRLVAPRP